MSCTQVTSEESDTARDRAFQNDLPLLRAEFAEDLQLGGAAETCDRALGLRRLEPLPLLSSSTV